MVATSVLLLVIFTQVLEVLAQREASGVLVTKALCLITSPSSAMALPIAQVVTTKQTLCVQVSGLVVATRFI